MAKTTPKIVFEGGAFNTLAQLQTGGMPIPATILVGKGSQPMTHERCQIRGKRKQVTQGIIVPLMLLAKQRGDKEFVKRFRNTYYCQNMITTHEGKIYGKYCCNRFCTICNSNRKAQLINQLRPIVATWEDPYLVTLTVANCKAQYLRRKIKKMYAVLKTIIDRHYKRYQRGKGFKLIGVRSLECTFNPSRRDYHPHIHMIVANKQIANVILHDWLITWGVHEASGSAQHKRPVEDLEHDLIETIKYCAKIFTEPDPKSKAGKKGKRDIYIKALYNIIRAMNGIRLFEKFGFEYTVKRNSETTAPKLVTDFQEWFYVPEELDWIATDTGNPLTAYKPTNELTDLLENHIDMQLE